jgi:putrescine transport system substrate-binding protein
VSRFSSSGYIEEMASGATCVVMGFTGDINIAASRAAAAKTKTPVVIQALVPKTGATLFFDSMAIPKDAKNVENAHLFINYILRPEVHASLTNKVFYANPNTASMKFVNKDVAANRTVFPEAEALRSMVVPEALPQNVRKVQARAYAVFKSGL